jgi:hypothetical protein
MYNKLQTDQADFETTDNRAVLRKYDLNNLLSIHALHAPENIHFYEESGFVAPLRLHGGQRE